MANYTYIPENNFSGGIDQHSAESNIREGYVEDALNVDIQERRLVKRPGYQSFAGSLPFRVEEVTYDSTANTIQFKLNEAIDLTNIGSTPIVVYGRTALDSGSYGGDFSSSSDTGEYYSSITSDPRTTLSGASTTIDDAPFTHSNVLVGTTESLSASNQDHDVFEVDTIDINSTSYDITLAHTLTSSVSSFVYFKDVTPSSGSIYQQTTALASGTNTITITAATHGLSNYNIIPKLELDDTTTWEKVEADSFVIDTAGEVTITYTYGATTANFVDGDVTVGTDNINVSSHGLADLQAVELTTTGTLPSGLSTSTTYYVIKVDDDNFKLATSRANAEADTAVDITAAAGGGTHTVSTTPDLRITLIAAEATNIVTDTFSASVSTQTMNITGQTDPFIFLALYEEDTGTGDLTLVKPDGISYDESAEQFDIDLVVGTSTTYVAYYTFGFTLSNLFTVTPTTTVTSDGNDESPQMTIWGLPHSSSGIYGANKIAREGWTNHLDSYRSDLEERLVAGIGGNIYTDLAKANISSEYLIPDAFAPKLRNRVNTATVLSPVFHETGETPARSGGYITSTGLPDTNKVEVSTIEYQTSGGNSGTVKLTLNVPSVAIFDSTGATDTIGDVISTTTDLEDYITVSQTGYSVHNGTFKISAVEEVDSTTIAIYVVNSEVTDSDFDETDVGGLAGIFTDNIPLSSTSYFIPNDTITISGTTYTVKSSTSSAIVVSGVTATASVANGLRIVGTRSSGVIPLRSDSTTSDVSNYVRGDTVVYTGRSYNHEILYVNAVADTTVDITGDGTTATVTLGSGDTAHLNIGQKIILAYAGDYTGVQTITDIPTTTTFEFASTSTDTENSKLLVGKTIELGEDLSWSDSVSDSNTVTVSKRWIPIEMPTDSYGLTPARRVYHFDSNSFTQQDFLRSVMVSDNLYLSNYGDEVRKYDGSNLYRAGLFRWQCGLFASVDTSGSDGINIGRQTTSAVSANTTGGGTGAKFHVPIEDKSLWSVGDKIVHDDDSAEYYITGITDDGTEAIIETNNPISGAASGNINIIRQVRYYFRLNAIDSNNNIIASAVTGHDNFRIEISDSSDIHLRLVGMPAWDDYDYDRLEVEIYRTPVFDLGELVPDFYKIVTLPMGFDATDGYIDFTDTTPDDSLSQGDVVNVSLLGGEIGTTWTEPPRAKYVTSANNQLVLANTQDYPQADIVFDGSGATNTNLAGLIFTIEKTAQTSAPTDTDNVNYQRFEWMTSGDIASTLSRVDATTLRHTVASTTGLAVGDWVYGFYKGTAPADLSLDGAGWYQVEALTSTTIDIAAPTSAALSSTNINRVIWATEESDVPVYLGSDDANYQMEDTSSDKTVAMLRLANAINSVQRTCSTTDFEPYVVANSDDTYANGQIVLRSPKAASSLFNVRLPTTTSFDMYVNGVLQASAAQVSSVERIFPSRVLVSYENYPEIFDNPTAVLPQDGESVVDVNPADGQQITGVIPFFGDSAFGGAQKSSVIVVFKENSIYLVDLTAKAQGLKSASGGVLVQKLETRGLGCTAPYSIAATKDGIMFANEAGLYRLNRNLSITYVGQNMERLWLETVNRDQLAIMQGHHYAIGKTYKLSVPVDSGETPTQVYVYHHSSEQKEGIGGWTRYDAHEAVGWANLASDAFFGDTKGRVCQIRRTGSSSDFRDFEAGVDASITTRALDFGQAGIRKVVPSVAVHYRTPSDIEGTAVSYSYDLSVNFNSMDAVELNRAADDGYNRKGKTVKMSVDKRRAVYFQVKLTNSTVDEPLDVAGLTFKVGGLTDREMLQAASTVSGS